MKSTSIIIWSAFAALPLAGADLPQFSSRISEKAEPVEPGKFQPSWESLKQYEVPEWFRDAKFGIWAHWGPQCQVVWGGWCGRFMYQEGSDDNKFHVGH